jgi:glycosyltransferase involved in cell wall biosynthesis
LKDVLVITNNLQQASFRLRIEALKSLLESRGIHLDIQVRPRNFFSRRNLLRTAANYDAVILQRKLLDPLDAKLLRRHARKIFYDIDDAVMYHAHPVGWISRFRTRRRFDATAKIVHTAVVGNEYLAQIFRERGIATTVLPTCVDPNHYIIKQHAATSEPKLVWIGSHSTLPYLHEHLPAIEAAAREVSNLRLTIIADESLHSDAISIGHIKWSADAEAAALASADIGIAPTPRDRWTLGKCGFKIVQYMAAGLPTIASPVGANEQLVRNDTGILATTPAEWTQAIVKLARNAELRAQLGKTARQRVIDEYSFTRAADVWSALLSA